MDNLRNVLNGAGTIIWNGPIGVFEIEKFNTGTRKLSDYLAATNAKVILGGEIQLQPIRFGFKDKFHHISTGVSNT